MQAKRRYCEECTRYVPAEQAVEVYPARDVEEACGLLGLSVDPAEASSVASYNLLNAVEFVLGEAPYFICRSCASRYESIPVSSGDEPGPQGAEYVTCGPGQRHWLVPRRGHLPS